MNYLNLKNPKCLPIFLYAFLQNVVSLGLMLPALTKAALSYLSSTPGQVGVRPETFSYILNAIRTEQVIPKY